MWPARLHRTRLGKAVVITDGAHGGLIVGGKGYLLVKDIEFYFVGCLGLCDDAVMKWVKLVILIPTLAAKAFKDVSLTLPFDIIYTLTI